MKFVFASSNAGKCREVKAEASLRGIQVFSAEEIRAEKDLVAPPEVVEDAPTYEGNAALKSRAYAQWCGLPALADDSGLEVEHLGGAPGLYTARYAGPGCTPADNIEKLLLNMTGVSNRTARFCCALSFSVGENEYFKVTAYLPGSITVEKSGEGGFGYDPVFIPDGYDRTLAELKGAGVPVQTHRVRALKTILPLLEEFFVKEL